MYKIFIFIFIYLFIPLISYSQDTLSCKTDLAWDSQGKFYYKKSEPNKVKYSGPAKCYPKKGIENRGTLKNGAWDGAVYGYKNNKLIGYAHFNEGFYHGTQVKYFEDGRIKDSMMIEKGKEIYVKKFIYDKKNTLKNVSIIAQNSDSIYKSTEKYKSGLKINYSTYNLNLKTKDLITKEYYLDYDENEKAIYNIYQYKKFKNNKELEFERFYDSGIPYRDDYFENGKKVKEIIFYGDYNQTESIMLYQNGKLNGETKRFDVDGKLIRIENYKKGKMINAIDIE